MNTQPITARVRQHFALITLLFLTCASSALALSPAQPAHLPIEYTVRLHQPHTQMIDMLLTLRGVQDDIIELALPTWRPGRYEILDPAGTVREVRARSGRGLSLPIEKFEKSAWALRTDAGNGDDVVTIEYRVYANSLANRTRHVDDTHAFLSPSSVFMYAPAMRDFPLRVRIDAPEGWEVATGLEPDPAASSSWIAPNYDTLVDSPFEVGLHELMQFDLDGTPHEIAIWIPGPRPGPQHYSEVNLTRDFAAIVRAQRDIFGDLPYSRYIFLIHCYPGGRGGTEHLNSTIMGVSPDAFASPQTYRRFLKLVSHEMFHTWNVKQFRPAGIHPYDYQRENYSHMFWLVEGTTSYYDWLTMARADLVSPDDYLKTLGDSIHTLSFHPGALVQSLEESSFDAWIKFNRPTPDSVNATVSFYSKGALVSLLLDMEMRARTQNRASLDDLMRHLYRNFPLDGPGYTRADVLAAVEAITDSDFHQFFEDYISGVKPLEYHILNTAGLVATPPPADPQRAYLGFNIETRDSAAAVTAVLANGPAYAAGLHANDIIVSINGAHLRPRDLDAHLQKLTPGDDVTLNIIRHELTREIRFKAAGQPHGKWTLRRTPTPAPAQRDVYESWLGQPWPGRAPARAVPVPATPEPTDTDLKSPEPR